MGVEGFQHGDYGLLDNFVGVDVVDIIAFYDFFGVMEFLLGGEGDFGHGCVALPVAGYDGSHCRQGYDDAFHS